MHSSLVAHFLKSIFTEVQLSYAEEHTKHEKRSTVNGPCTAGAQA